MATFPALYFSYATKYPTSGHRIPLANSYMFSSKPTSPDQRIFTLKLQGMQYFVDGSGDLDLAPEQGRNMAFLENFYLTHQLHTDFVFNHPVYGPLDCKFYRPLEIPEGIRGGNGTFDDIEVELIEQP